MVRNTIFLIIFLLSLMGCKKEINIPLEDVISKLVINANLDNDLKTFSIVISTSRPISSKIPALKLPDEIIVRLYHNDKLIPLDDLKLTPRTGNSKEGAVKIDSHETGTVYRLEVEASGFPIATASARIPQRPIVNSYMNFEPKVEIISTNRAWYPNDYHGGCSQFIPYNLKMSSTGDLKEYYIISSQKINEGSSYIASNNIGILNRLFLQDNPQVESEAILNNPDYNFFVFENYICSNFSFTTGESNLELLIGNCEFSENSYRRSLVTLSVTRLTTEAFRYLRTVIIQSKDFNFLNEPIAIESNIEGGYGCFSVTSTTTFPIFIY